MSATGTIRAVAAVEAVKGALSLLVATGLLALAHTDLHVLAARLVAHSHLNPAAKYPGIFLEAVDNFPNTRTLLLACGAALYASVRGLEAYGLYRERAWAEWLAAGSGAIYVPFELHALAHRPSVWALAFLVLNLAVVGVMLRALLRRRALREKSVAPAAAPRTDRE